MALTPEERVLLEGMSRRLDSLQKFTLICLRDGHFVLPVYTLMAMTVIKTLIILCGRRLYDDFFKWTLGALRDSHGMCKICGAPKTDLNAFACEKCIAEMEADDREVDIINLMDTANVPKERM